MRDDGREHAASPVLTTIAVNNVAEANGTNFDGTPADAPVELSGGIFVAPSVTASARQNILYVFGSNSSDVPESGGDTVYIHQNRGTR